MLALDPKYKLRRAKTNILLYYYDHILMDLAGQRALHPNDAILLSFFDGCNSMDDIKQAARYIWDLPEDKFVEGFDNFLKIWGPYLIDAKGKVRNDNPHDFIIPAYSIDLNEIMSEAPLFLALLTTHNCAAECLYCYADRWASGQDTNMPFKLIERVIEQAKDLKVEYLTLSGGDPFTRPDIIMILELILQACISVQLSTKVPLSENTIAALKDMGVPQIQISIDCLDDALAKRLTGIKQYATLALRTIERICACGIRVTTNTVVTGLNIDVIPQLVEHLAKSGVAMIRLSQYHRSAYAHQDSLFISREAAQILQQFINDFRAQNTEVRVIFSNNGADNQNPFEDRMAAFLKRAACGFGRMSFLIQTNGKVLPCEQLPCTPDYIIGDINDQSLIDIWRSPSLLELMKPPHICFKGSICFECEHFESCIYKKGWCIRDVWKSYQTLYQVHPSCPKADSIAGRRLF